MSRPLHEARASERGLTMLEVIVSLVIAAFAVINTMDVLGSAQENVVETRERRRMRYLAELIAANIQVGKIDPAAEVEPFEEGMTEPFEGIGSSENPDEYIQYEYYVDVLREVVLTNPAGTEAEDPFGPERDRRSSLESGMGRPVTNDPFALGFGEEEEEEPDGPLKRVLVVTIRRIGREADDDLAVRLMTYLSQPGEEEYDPTAGAGGALGAGAGAEGGAGAGGDGGGEAAARGGGRSDGGDR